MFYLDLFNAEHSGVKKIFDLQLVMFPSLETGFPGNNIDKCGKIGKTFSSVTIVLKLF